MDYNDFSLYLDPVKWELTLDEYGNITTCEGEYAIAQNVANAVRLFTRDAWFHQEDGIPHYDVELGKKPPYALLRSYIVSTAQSVDGVAEANVTWFEFDPQTKEMSGNILIKTKNGATTNVSF